MKDRVGDGGRDGDDGGFAAAGAGQVGAVQEMKVQFRHIAETRHQIMLELGVWADEQERTRTILQRFREEYERQREERERFERAVETGDLPGGERKERLNPYIEVRFRRFRI